MANIDGNLLITQTTGDSDSADLSRLNFSFSGNIHNLPVQVLDNTTADDTTSNNVNGNFNNGGTNVQPGGHLTIGNATEVFGGAIQIRGHDVSSTPNNTPGGRLTIDGGTLTCSRLGMQGFGPVAASPGASATNPGPSARDFKNRPDSELPTLELINGAILNVGASSYQDYRGFLGNWSAGRIIGSDFTIHFPTVNPSGTWGGFGTNHLACFLGNQTNISDFTIVNPNRIEMNGPINLSDGTFAYQTSANWLSDGSGGAGAMGLIAGAPDTQATYGDTRIEIDTDVDIFPTTGNTAFKLGKLREAASRMTVNGEIAVVYGDTTYNTQNHWYGWQAGSQVTIDYNRQFDFRQTVAYRATLQNADGSSAGPAMAGKFGFIDQRDILQIKKTGFDATGSIGTAEYLWYTMPNHSIAANANAQRTMVGYPTGKGVGSGSQRSVNDTTAWRTLNYAMINDDTDSELTLDNNDGISTVSQHHRADMRRFNFRLGGSQYGYYPIFDNATYGSFDYLSPSTATVGEVRAIENGMNDLKNGYNIAHSFFQDEIVGSTPIATARAYDFTVTVQDTDDIDAPATVTCDTDDLTLDQLYTGVHSWAFDHMLDSDDTWSITNLDSTTRDASATSRSVDTDTLTTGQWRITAADGTIPGTNAAWPASGTIDSHSSNAVFSHCNGVVHEWKNGYIVVQDTVDRNNWAFYSFTKNYQVGAEERTAQVELIASNGSTGVPADNWEFQLFNLIDSSDNMTYTNRIRSYLWRDDVGLAPMESAGPTAAIKDLIIQQQSAGSLTKGELTGINLNQHSSFNANGMPILIDITAASNLATVTNLTANSTAADPAIADGVTISNATIDVVRGRRYIIAGDISQARFSVSGAGTANAEVLSIGNGALPTAAVSGITFSQFVEISFTAPTGVQFDTDMLDSELVFNMVALRGTSRTNLTNANVPLSAAPSNAISAGNLLYDNNDGNPSHVRDSEWRACSVNSDDTFDRSLGTIPSAWDTWTVTPSTNQRAIGIGIADDGLTETNARTLVEWIGDATANYVVAWRDADNYAVYDLQSPDVVTSSGNDLTFYAAIQSTLVHRGTPGTQTDRITWWFGCDTNGNDVNVFDLSAFRLPNGTPVVSGNGRVLTYQYVVPTGQFVYYAFAARRVGAEWYNVVEDNTEVVGMPNTQLTEISSALVPFNFSSNVNVDHTTFIRDNDVFSSLAVPVSATNRMEIELSSAATRGGAADGRYLHRLVQQKTLYLQNVARGNYPLDGWTFVFDRMTYSTTGINVQWRKQTANANAVSFDVSTVNATGSGVNNNITTTSTETYVLFRGATNIGVITPDQLATLAKVSDVWAANAAL